MEHLNTKIRNTNTSTKIRIENVKRTRIGIKALIEKKKRRKNGEYGRKRKGPKRKNVTRVPIEKKKLKKSVK